MTLIELKESLHKKIDSLDNEDYLAMLDEMISQREEVFIVPEHMKVGIMQGIDDVKNARVHTMDDFDKKYEKWLKE